MNKYLLGAVCFTLSWNVFAACQGQQQPLIVAGENICGSVIQSKAPGEISISMPAGPNSPLYLLHKNKLEKLSPGIFKEYVDNLKKDQIPAGVAHAISTIKFSADSLPQYANKTYNCGAPHIIETPKGNIAKAILAIPNCVMAAN